MGKNNNQRRKDKYSNRKSRGLSEKIEKWLIVCEGEKTEPQYLNDFLDYVENKFGKKLRNNIRIIGKGSNTLDLVELAIAEKSKSKIAIGKVFAVFDRDSFDKSNFDNAIRKCSSIGFEPIWSNECFEFMKRPQI